jgi:acyl-CoA synthetase (NDP forming)
VDSGVAIITMSSNVGFNITMQRRGLPIAYMVSLGNRLKFDLSDAIRLFASRKEVTAIGLYLEATPDPRGFQEAVEAARELGKPMVAVKTGRSQVAQQVVVSHTASLAGSDVLISALFERLGVARVDSLEALVEALKLLHVVGPLGGGRIGAMSTSGGDLTLLADALTPDLTLPPLSKGVAERLKAVVHERVVASNPFDYQMFSWDDADANAEIFGAFMAADFDIALCALDYPRADKCDQSTWGGAERGFVRATKATGTKGAVLATFADTVSEPVAERLMNDGVAMLAGIDDAVAAVQAALDVGRAWQKPPSQPLLVAPFKVDRDAVTVLDEAASKRMLAEAGVPVPESRIAAGAEEAAAAAEELVDATGSSATASLAAAVSAGTREAETSAARPEGGAPAIVAKGLGPSRPQHMEYSAPSETGGVAVGQMEVDAEGIVEVDPNASRAERRRAERANRKRR